MCKALRLKNENTVVTMLMAAGVPEPASSGMRMVQIELSHARFADAQAMTRQAGFDLERGLSEFVGIAAEDRTIRKALERSFRQP